MLGEVELLNYPDSSSPPLRVAKEANLDGIRVAEWKGYDKRHLVPTKDGQRFLDKWFNAAKKGELESFGIELAVPPWATYTGEKAGLFFETGRGGSKPSKDDRGISFNAIPTSYLERLNHIRIGVSHCVDESGPLHGEVSIRAFSYDQLERPLASKLINLGSCLDNGFKTVKLDCNEDQKYLFKTIKNYEGKI